MFKNFCRPRKIADLWARTSELLSADKNRSSIFCLRHRVIGPLSAGMWNATARVATAATPGGARIVTCSGLTSRSSFSGGDGDVLTANRCDWRNVAAWRHGVCRHDNAENNTKPCVTRWWRQRSEGRVTVLAAGGPRQTFARYSESKQRMSLGAVS